MCAQNSGCREDAEQFARRVVPRAADSGPRSKSSREKGGHSWQSAPCGQRPRGLTRKNMAGREDRAALWSRVIGANEMGEEDWVHVVRAFGIIIGALPRFRLSNNSASLGAQWSRTHLPMLREAGSIPGLGRQWHPAPGFLPEKSHGADSANYSPWGRKGVRHDLSTKRQQ